MGPQGRARRRGAPGASRDVGLEVYRQGRLQPAPPLGEVASELPERAVGDYQAQGQRGGFLGRLGHPGFLGARGRGVQRPAERGPGVVVLPLQARQPGGLPRPPQRRLGPLGQGRVVLGVAPAHRRRRRVALVRQALGGVLPHRLQQPVAPRRPRPPRPGAGSGPPASGRPAVPAGRSAPAGPAAPAGAGPAAGADRLGRRQVEAPGEHRQAGEQGLLGRRQQVVAPVQRGPQRLLARAARPAARRRAGPGGRPGGRPAPATPSPRTRARRQLDGQGQPVQPAAHLGHRPRVAPRSARSPGAAAAARSTNRRTAPGRPARRRPGGTARWRQTGAVPGEQSGSPRARAPATPPRRPRSRGSRLVASTRRAGAGRQQAGRQRRRRRRAGARSCPAPAAGPARRRPAPGPRAGAARALRHPQGDGDRRGHQRRVGEGRQVGERRLPREGLARGPVSAGHLARDRQRQARLADPAGAGEGQQARRALASAPPPPPPAPGPRSWSAATGSGRTARGPGPGRGAGPEPGPPRGRRVAGAAAGERGALPAPGPERPARRPTVSGRGPPGAPLQVCRRRGRLSPARSARASCDSPAASRWRRSSAPNAAGPSPPSRLSGATPPPGASASSTAPRPHPRPAAAVPGPGRILARPLRRRGRRPQTPHS